MTMDVARRLVKKYSGLATVYACPFCSHFEKFPHGRGGGRGYGLRMGGALHSKLAAHIRAEHPAELAQAADVMSRPRSFHYRGEAQRSEAMDEARWLQRDLQNTTKGKWTFHHHNGRADEPSFYLVTEYSK
jgi:hypothetical protein